jgi:hypothetical protein
MRRAADGCDGETRGCAGVAGGSAARVARLLSITAHRTPRRRLGESALLAGNGSKAGLPAHVLGCCSRTAAKFGRRARLIDEKIIGRGMRGLAPRVAGRSALVIRCRPLIRVANRGGVFALLHQPARKHGRGVFFEPGIQQLSDLLAEIGSVAQAGEFITLERIAGRREKELPRRLGFVIQRDLQGKRRYITSVVTTVNSTQIRTYCGNMCKSFGRNYKQRTSASSGLLGTL